MKINVYILYISVNLPYNVMSTRYWQVVRCLVYKYEFPHIITFRVYPETVLNRLVHKRISQYNNKIYVYIDINCNVDNMNNILKIY